MNKFDEFVERYKSEIPMYKAWGSCVRNYIIDTLNLSDAEYGKLIKIPVEPRVKSTASIVQKAFCRGKDYMDPYNQITDKVGIRFVVMVIKQIKIISDIVEQADIWDCSKDKDFEESRETHPEVFEYESIHYIVRAARAITYEGVQIEKGTPCEIQIRTLEQHAYAELSHDYFYKNDFGYENDMKRNLARGMALNETTDLLFGEVYDMIEKEKNDYYELNKELLNIMEFKDYDDELNRSMYNSLSSMIERYVSGKVNLKEEIAEDIIENVRGKRDTFVLYKQPMVLILYYLAQDHAKEMLDEWEFTPEMLTPIYVDMGISME